MAFIMRNHHKLQAGRGVNALMYLDYLISAPVRIFIFDNRIEIISPGTLPDNQTVEKIRNANSNHINPILVSFIAKGLLPYRGLGSGIKRALENWPDIDFIDDSDGGIFSASIHRKERKSSEKIISLMRDEPELSAKDIAIRLCLTPQAIEKQKTSLRKLEN